MIKTCIICGNTFEVANWNKNKKFCSKKCQFKGQEKNKITKICKTCGKTFEVKPSREEANFCSKECFYTTNINKKKGNIIEEYQDYAVIIINSKKFNTIKVLIDKEDIEKN